MHSFKRNEIIILMGAGASVEAGIPHSGNMISQLEKRVHSLDQDWSKFQKLYDYIRSAIIYGDGIKGRQASYNIERLVATLEELSKKDDHTLFPFVGAWNPKLLEVAGNEFGLVKNLKDKIVDILLREWIGVKRKEEASYYEGLIEFQHQYEHPLRIFTLNYDLCVELACESKLHKKPERGFQKRFWDWRLFEDNPNDPKGIFLYKLHGSIDWTYDKDQNGKLTYFDSPSSIQPNEVAIIFGTTYKLQYLDPFLFLTYEFRKWTLEAKLIIVIGYGFGDDHINGIIGQALNNSGHRKLLCISSFRNEELDDARHRISKLLRLNGNGFEKIICIKSGAKEFMTNHLKIEKLSDLFSDDSILFDEV